MSATPTEFLQNVGPFDWPPYVEKVRADVAKYVADVQDTLVREFAFQLCCALAEGAIDGEFARRAFCEVYAAADLSEKRRELAVAGSPQ